MTVRLTVRTAMWRSHVARTVAAYEAAGGEGCVVPVVKGNGYGFGRGPLATIAADIADTVAVGTVHELDGLPVGVAPVVLTPTLQMPPDAPPGTVLTVGAPAHVDTLAGWRGPVIVKLASSMRRHGRGPELIDAARHAGLDVVGVGVHPPLAGTDDDHRAEIDAAITAVDPALDVWISHLGPATLASLPASHRYRVRLGTALWHGDKSFLHLGADVLDVAPVTAGTTAGYRQRAVPADGHLVIVGAGTAHGVVELADGRSPFHHARRRLALLEPPHMHTSMAFVPTGEPLPAIGERVDVQRPLISTAVDTIEWI